MKKVVLMLDLPDDENAKRQAFVTVSLLSGVDSITMDMKEKKLTVIGSVDPVTAVSKLRQYWPTEIISVETKEEPKKEEAATKKEEAAKKEEPKKEEAAKQEEPPKKEKEKKEEGEKKKEVIPNLVWDLVKTLPSVASVISCILINL